MGVLVELLVDWEEKAHFERKSNIINGERIKEYVKCWEIDTMKEIKDEERIKRIEYNIDNRPPDSDSDSDSDDPYEWMWRKDLEEERKEEAKKKCDKEFDDLFGFRLFGYKDK